MAKCTHVLRTHTLAIHSRAWQHPVFKIVQEPRYRCKLLRETLLQRCLLPDIRQTLSDYHFVFQQDDAPSHPAKSTAEFLQRTVPNFIEPSVWPPNSPDLNPVNYAVWGALQQSVYHIPISNLDDLKDRVCTCWKRFDQQIINKSIDHWRDKLKAVVWVNGGHIEQLFWIQYLLNLLSCSVVYRKFVF